MRSKKQLKKFLKIDIYQCFPAFLVIFALFFILYDWYPGGLDNLSWLIGLAYPYPLSTVIINIFLALIFPTLGGIFFGMYVGSKLKKGNKLLLIIWIIYFIAYIGWLLFLTTPIPGPV